MVTSTKKRHRNSSVRKTPMRFTEYKGSYSSQAKSHQSIPKITAWCVSLLGKAASGSKAVSNAVIDATNDFVDGFLAPFRFVTSTTAAVTTFPFRMSYRIYKTIENASVTREETLNMLEKMEKRIRAMECDMERMKKRGKTFSEQSTPFATPGPRRESMTPLPLTVPSVLPEALAPPPPPPPPPPAPSTNVKRRIRAAQQTQAGSKPEPTQAAGPLSKTSPALAVKRPIHKASSVPTISLSDISGVKLRRVSPRIRKPVSMNSTVFAASSSTSVALHEISDSILGNSLNTLRKVNKSPGGTPLRPSGAHMTSKGIPVLSFGDEKPSAAVLPVPLSLPDLQPSVVPPPTGTPTVSRQQSREQNRFAVPLKPKAHNLHISMQPQSKKGSILRDAADKENQVSFAAV